MFDNEAVLRVRSKAPFFLFRVCLMKSLHSIHNVIRFRGRVTVAVPAMVTAIVHAEAGPLG